MVFHLWNEVYVDGIWCPLDAAYALGGADAARIKIADDSLQNDSFAAICRSIISLIGHIEIKIVQNSTTVQTDDPQEEMEDNER
jgi:hypothetical protein